MKTTLSILILVAGTFFLSEREFRVWNTSNSELPENDIQTVAVDSKGTKWIGTTTSGLVKMVDGELSVFNADNSPVDGQYLGPIFIDSNENVWVSQAKPDGLHRFDGENWTSFSSKDLGLSKISVIDMCEDVAGNIYVGGAAGLSRYDGSEWKRISLPGKGSYTIRAIDVAEDNSLAVGHNGGLLLRNEDEWEILTTDNSELQNYVRAVKYVGTERLYIGYGGNVDGGYSVLENEKWKHTNKGNSELSDNMVRDIEIDSDGVMWLATNDGLVVVDKNEITPIFFREGVYQNVISDIALEGSSAWVATRFGIVKVE